MTRDQGTKRIGMITPSSNTVVEPMAAAILHDVHAVSLHASRLKVTDISLEDAAAKQFELDAYLSAAALLADARVDVIGWNGTSASWRGFEHDQDLCETIAATFGVASTTAVLAINELLAVLAARRIALVTPYVDEVQERIKRTYQDAGYACVDERHFGERVNYAFAEVPEDVIAEAVRAVARSGPEAIVIMCTNLRSAHLAASLESELDVPILDSVSAFVWKAVRLCGVDTAQIRGWGRLFDVSVPS